MLRVETKLVLYIVPNRKHSYRHAALSEISNRIVGKILLRTIWYLSSDEGFTNMVVWSTESPGVQAKYGMPTVRGQWVWYQFFFLVTFMFKLETIVHLRACNGTDLECWLEQCLSCIKHYFMFVMRPSNTEWDAIKQALWVWSHQPISHVPVSIGLFQNVFALVLGHF